MTIIGVTDEGKGDTEKWIASKGAKYPYGYDKGGKLKSFFGVGGIPHAVLVDPTGTVVWSGHPASLTSALVEENLGGALAEPLWKWPASAKKVRQALQKRQYSKALDEARALGDEGTKLVAALEAMVRGKVSSLKTAAEQADWLAVDERGKQLAKELAGLPELAEVTALLERLDGDASAQKVLAAQREVRKLTGGRMKKGDIPRIEKKLKDIAAQFPNSGASRDASRAMDAMRSG